MEHESDDVNELGIFDILSRHRETLSGIKM